MQLMGLSPTRFLRKSLFSRYPINRHRLLMSRQMGAPLCQRMPCLTRGACLLMPPGSAGGLHLLNRALEGPTWQGVIWGLALISRDPHLTQRTTNWGPLTPGLDLPFLNLWTSISNSSGVYLDNAFFYRLPAFTIS